MSQKVKLISKLKTVPKDFTYDDAKALLEWLGYKESNKGKTSGSRVSFVKDNSLIILHKPHPRKELLVVQVKELIRTLEQEGLI
ncbi:MAG: type II toxin-antitoxin system HicA family toxin [Oscillospiraceae bacterium]|nr:type II toxin-antitoxin system HicA family toxin [Candidatus Limimonas egerieequi]